MAVDPESVKRLMALVMKQLEATGPTDLVVKLGLTAEVPNAPRLAANWLAGVNAPRFDYTMTMLSKAGLLTPAAEQAWRGDRVDPAARGRAAIEEARAAEERLTGERGSPARRRKRTG